MIYFYRFISPLLTRFVNEQKKGFPFPEGKECAEDMHKHCKRSLEVCVGNNECSMTCLTDHCPIVWTKLFYSLCFNNFN